MERIKIDTPTLKKLIGTRVKYVLKSLNNYDERHGTITEIIRKQVDFGNRDFISFSRIHSITIL